MMQCRCFTNAVPRASWSVSWRLRETQPGSPRKPRASPARKPKRVFASGNLPSAAGPRVSLPTFFETPMFRIKDGSLRLFRVAGIDVLIHWSWLVIAVVELHYRKNAYQSDLWNVAE